MTDFWKDRAPSASETGAHLAAPINAAEMAISHLSFANQAPTRSHLTPDQRHRADRLVRSIIERLRGETT